ncbi:MAG: ABC transporter ATP-binding protein [Candidatus Nomurabacteria bacterium]|nr:MAG: ABC transporter ATP-binding protein [Candidatus Nomurabacteria bacterium]
MGKQVLQPIIEVKDLNVTYFMGRKNEVKALQRINLEIYPGEFIIFFGPSGCGKSTLLYSIAGLETHTHGNISVDKKDIAHLTMREIAEYRQHKIGMIFQAFYLIPTLSVRKNVLLPQMAIHTAVAERTKLANELLKHFGVITQAEKLPTELSGGQQQRVAICRALVNNPDIVLADEPVGNLDSKSANDVMDLIHELNEKRNKTIILVTHNPAHLHLAHRVFYMKDGQIIQTKVNRAIHPGVKEVKEVPPVVPHNLELLLRSYTTLEPQHIEHLLLPYKSREIVTEVLTGLTLPQLSKLEEQVQHMLMSGLREDQRLEQLLDLNIEDGGFGLDHRTAEKMTEKIAQLVEEIKLLQQREGEAQATSEEERVHTIRHYLLDVFAIHMRSADELRRFNTVLQNRLQGVIDQKEAFRQFDLPWDEGGLGYNRQTARKLARRLELIMLGKYQVE